MKVGRQARGLYPVPVFAIKKGGREVGFQGGMYCVFLLLVKKILDKNFFFIS